MNPITVAFDNMLDENDLGFYIEMVDVPRVNECIKFGQGERHRAKHDEYQVTKITWFITGVSSAHVDVQLLLHPIGVGRRTS